MAEHRKRTRLEPAAPKRLEPPCQFMPTTRFCNSGIRRSDCRRSSGSGRSIFRRLSTGHGEQRPRSRPSPAQPRRADFANTIEALERSGKLLNRVGRVFHNLTRAPPTRRSTRSTATTRRSWRRTTCGSCSMPALFARVDALYRRRDASACRPSSCGCSSGYHLRFVRDGARLGAEREGAHGGDLGAARHAAHAVRPERAARRGRMAARARRGRPRRAARLRPRCRGRRRLPSAASPASTSSRWRAPRSSRS